MFRMIAVCVSSLTCFALFANSVFGCPQATEVSQQQSSTDNLPDAQQVLPDQETMPVPDDVPDLGDEESNEQSKPDFHPDLLKQLNGATSLNPNKTAFLNLPEKKTFLKTRVACNSCLLEMLLCPIETKEHESVLSFDGKAYVVHTALLAMGLKPGHPVIFSPEYQAPDGPILNIKVHWRNKQGKLKSVDVRTWMRTSVSHYFSSPLAAPPAGIEFPFLELRYDPYNKDILWYGQMSPKDKKTLLSKSDNKDYQAAIEDFYQKSQPKPMKADFVFTGSFLAKRTEDSPEFYAGEDGYLICVANFAAATIDIKEASSASDGSQAFEADSNSVPVAGTPVILEISAAR